MKLYPYQEEGKRAIKECFSRGIKRVILCIPTGGGKTVTFADIASDVIKKGNSVTILVNRDKLLSQAAETLRRYGLNPEIVKGGRIVRQGRNCYVCTVQTLTKRIIPKTDLLIVDEAHLQIFDKILTSPEYENTFVIGATATPIRTGKMKQLSDTYGEMIEPVKVSELIKNGFLVPAITFGAKVDTSKIKTKGEDFDTTEVGNFFDKPKRYADMIGKYEKLAKGTKFICFDANRENALKSCKAFNDAGYPTAYIDANTKDHERKRIFKSFARGYYIGLCNVDLLTAGFDEWTIETVILNLATKSVPKFMQMAGRGSRKTPAEFVDVPGRLQKSHFNLIDMGGNVIRLGFWEDERTFNLAHKTKDKSDAAPVKICPEDEKDLNGVFGCGAMLHASVTTCKHCGYIYPVKKQEFIEVDFEQLFNTKFLPEGFIAKNINEMSLSELEAFREQRGYKLGWITRQIHLREDLNLIDYAVLKGYKNPEAWVNRTIELIEK